MQSAECIMLPGPIVCRSCDYSFASELPFAVLIEEMEMATKFVGFVKHRCGGLALHFSSQEFDLIAGLVDFF